MKIYIGFLYIQDSLRGEIEHVDKITFRYSYTKNKDEKEDINISLPEGENNCLSICESEIKLFELGQKPLNKLMKILYFLDIYNNHNLKKFQNESDLSIKINSKNLCNDKDGLNLIIPIIFANLNEKDDKECLENILYMSTNLIGDDNTNLKVKPHIDNLSKEALKMLEIKYNKDKKFDCYINASPRGLVYVIYGSFNNNNGENFFESFIDSYYRCSQINTYKTIVSNIHLLITLLNRLSEINTQGNEIDCDFMNDILEIKNNIIHVYKIEHFNSMDGDLNNKIFKKLMDEFYKIADICERKLNIMENYLKLKIFKYNLEDI